ncbi:hypothetical protein AVEN_10427-1 [Araneus ventricosus]|uniref:Uncharacterized protein n=1 Tax=Araneus ventricosus TaxID=182803 RepID=A0A4Y2NV72_ARAVE|nr:hypothetical protein AVEN_10427-1 [Araneus ventricosus]
MAGSMHSSKARDADRSPFSRLAAPESIPAATRSAIRRRGASRCGEEDPDSITGREKCRRDGAFTKTLSTTPEWRWERSRSAV